MTLTRHQADLVLRHYTAAYAKEVHEEPDVQMVGAVARELSWRLNSDVSRVPLLFLLLAWQRVHAGIPEAEQDVNLEVNTILDNAGFRPPHILRYSEPVSA